MNVSILICTFGDREWKQLAERRALPSASMNADDHHEVLLTHEDEGTLAEVRNKAALKAAGEWLCFLDADDELELGYMAAMNAARRELGGAVSSVSLLVPAVQYVTVLEERTLEGFGSDAFPVAVTKSDPPKVLNDGRPLYAINRAVIGTLVPRELFLHLGGFRADLSLYEDWELWLRCERAGAELIDVPGAVYRAYRRKGSRNEAPRPESQRIYWQIRSAYETKAA